MFGSRAACSGLAAGGDKGARGRLAQLVERLLYTQDVGGSSPVTAHQFRSIRRHDNGGNQVMLKTLVAPRSAR